MEGWLVLVFIQRKKKYMQVIPVSEQIFRAKGSEKLIYISVTKLMVEKEIDKLKSSNY